MIVKFNYGSEKSEVVEIQMYYRLETSESTKANIEIRVGDSCSVVDLDDFKKAINFLEEDLRIFEKPH